MKVTVDGKEGEFKHLDSTPPLGAKEASVMTMEATVENVPQKLRTIRPMVYAAADIPRFLGGEAQLVLHHILNIFVEKQVVREGTLGDLVFGCQHARLPLPELLVIVGVRQLIDAGFVLLQAPDNEILSFQSSRLPEAWIKYTDKFLDLVYGRSEA